MIWQMRSILHGRHDISESRLSSKRIFYLHIGLERKLLWGPHKLYYVCDAILATEMVNKTTYSIISSTIILDENTCKKTNGIL